jgi:enoyl-CoA hydratase/carnithine racemase
MQGIIVSKAVSRASFSCLWTRSQGPVFRPAMVIPRALSSSSSSTSTSTSTSSNRVETTIENGIARVVLNRPDKLNAVDLEMFRAIKASILSLQKNKSVRVVLLIGKGRAFCSGLDVTSVFASPLSATKELFDRRQVEDDHSGSNKQKSKTRIANLAQEVAYLWRRLPVPVIAVVHHSCLGAGLQIALGADIRIATADAKLVVMEAKWGLIPDMSASVTLRELVRMDVAKELTYTGRVVS